MSRAVRNYQAIARQEPLSRERVRRIVAKSLAREDGASLPDPRRVRMAQLGPASRLAASAGRRRGAPEEAGRRETIKSGFLDP